MRLTVLSMYPRVGIFLGAEAIPTLFRRSSGSISVFDPCEYDTKEARTVADLAWLIHKMMKVVDSPMMRIFSYFMFVSRQGPLWLGVNEVQLFQ